MDPLAQSAVCPQCASPITTADKFCPGCGTRFIQDRRAPIGASWGTILIGLFVIATGGFFYSKSHYDRIAQEERDRAAMAREQAEVQTPVYTERSYRLSDQMPRYSLPPQGASEDPFENHDTSSNPRTRPPTTSDGLGYSTYNRTSGNAQTSERKHLSLDPPKELSTVDKIRSIHAGQSSVEVNALLGYGEISGKGNAETWTYAGSFGIAKVNFVDGIVQSVDLTERSQQ